MSVPRLRRHRVRPACRAALRVALGLALVWLAAVPAPAAPQASAKDLYLSAQAREQAVRAALDASPPNPPPTRDAMRQVAAAYRQVVCDTRPAGIATMRSGSRRSCRPTPSSATATIGTGRPHSSC